MKKPPGKKYMTKGTSVSLCNYNSWCPAVSFDGRKVTIEDKKDGRSISFSKTEWNRLLSFVGRGKIAPVK
ncbi:MAG: hypothetical protein A3H68_02450 [Candidatus Taylorbacteria bacterium RIFCSPLOWO2_02_FULL_46_40]|uniref:DUF397 domain-containing protein n=1 Tax=Candidatus Taylorbacteria bacterium RIFCSPLOWO2_02_FULL_46_40 TaxID=1802329 RepID=A0A1G2P0T2_9BACT|nr:MAG: hypothetical protein A3H68_02450 [Candidatus Taylorbacteria bacterium RIFCSPLOWO2_02_FULL_46_40]